MLGPQGTWEGAHTRSSRAVEWSPFRPDTFGQHVMWNGLRSQNWVCSLQGKPWGSPPTPTQSTGRYHQIRSRQRCTPRMWVRTQKPSFSTVWLDELEEAGALVSNTSRPMCRCAPGPEVRLCVAHGIHRAEPCLDR